MAKLCQKARNLKHKVLMLRGRKFYKGGQRCPLHRVEKY